MIEELFNKLPDEVVWHVIKYLKHPIIEIIEEGILESSYINCDMCRKIIFLETGNWKTTFNQTICGNCYITHRYEIELEEYKRYNEYSEELREGIYGYYDNSDDSE